MESKDFPQHLANDVVLGKEASNHDLLSLLKIKSDGIMGLLQAADGIRHHFFGNEIHMCTITNGKSGKCGENCSFCSQSVSAKTDISAYPLQDEGTLAEGGVRASQTPINRFSIVTSGGKLPKKEVARVADALQTLEQQPVNTCASLGTLETEELQVLKAAGVDRYHHNLESSRSYFSNICSTHSYQDRVDTVKRAQQAGYSICSGGIFGMGETDTGILELACELKQLDVDAIPINFLVPIDGTRLAEANFLTPLRCLQIIAFFRFALPQKDLIICGGREHNLRELHSLIFQAGANGIMTGNYLTTEGRTLEKDLTLIKDLGLKVRSKS